MNQNRNNNTNRRNEDNNADGWIAAGVTLAGAAAAGGLLYWLTSGSKEKEPPQQHQQRSQSQLKPQGSQPETSSGTMSSLVSLMSSLASPLSNTEYYYKTGEVTKQGPPENPFISNLNSLLADIHVRYIQFQDGDFKLHYGVFDTLLHKLHAQMQEVDAYYRKYCSTRQFAGSHYDNLRIKKPDEFDMDFVIRLPLNLSAAPMPGDSDMVIEPKEAGYVHLRMGTQFQRLPYRDGGEWAVNKTAYDWMDQGTKYLLRSKFMDWWKSVVNKALNTFEQRNGRPIIDVDGVEYEIRDSESGPAKTLYIINVRGGFKLDVDLVPALKFPESRWPITSNYREIPESCSKDSWMVVGKPNKEAPEYSHARYWRIALHNQERGLMHDSQHLRQALRLMKKLRDEQGMKKIASYYLKVLFFWEISEQNRLFWRKNPAELFTHMVKKLHVALVNGNIPYFWNKRNNLIGSVDRRTLSEYAAKLVPLIQLLENPGNGNYKTVAKYLLSVPEFQEYNRKFLHI